MGAVLTIVDAALFLFFLVIAIGAPLIDGQSVLPPEFYPRFLVDLNNWYIKEYGDYLSGEKPHFFVGLVALELVFQWPLALICLYGIAASKSWLPTTCLMYGVSTFTSMVAILAELTGSKKASDDLLKMYFPFLGFALLAIIRGLLPHSSKSTSIGKDLRSVGRRGSRIFCSRDKSFVNQQRYFDAFFGMVLGGFSY